MFNDTDVLKIRMRDWGVRESQGLLEGDRKESMEEKGQAEESNEEGLLNASDQILQASSHHTRMLIVDGGIQWRTQAV